MRYPRSLAAIGTLSLVALAGPALAGTTASVEVGGNSSGDHPFTATTKGVVHIRINGPSGDVIWGCESATATGVVHAGSVTQPPSLVATITDTTWTGCIAWGGLELSMQQIGDWHINATGNTATINLDDIVEGNISNLNARLYAKPLATLCDFTIGGTADGEFDEDKGSSIQQLRVDETGYTGNLGVTALTSGCLGLIAATNEADLALDWDLNSPNGLINLID